MEDSSNLDTIKGFFDKWGQWEKSITNNIAQYTNKGLLRADGKKLRDALQSKVKKELTNLRNHLNQIAEGVHKNISKEMEKISEDVKRGM